MQFFEGYFMGEVLGILYNQTFFCSGLEYLLSDECSLLFICYARHVPATTEMISFLLSGAIIKIQATDCRNYIQLLGSELGSHPGIGGNTGISPWR